MFLTILGGGNCPVAPLLVALMLKICHNIH